MPMRSKPLTDLLRTLPPDEGFALISNRKLFEIFATMLHCRLLVEQLPALVHEGGFAPTGDAPGFEAERIACTIDLLGADTLAPGAQALAPCIVKGLPMASLHALARSAATRTPWSRYRLIAPALPLEEQLERALNAAAVNKAEKKKKIAVALCGDYATAKPALRKAMARAGKQKLPVLFVCRNTVDGEDAAASATRYGLPGIAADLNDAVALYRVATESIAHARRGNGATLIECRPWPLADTPADPIALIEQALIRRRIFSARLKAQTAALFKRQFAVR
jgi:TPP-dependent pyruvate/acetoin dehydrogenase alpha subunit